MFNAISPTFSIFGLTIAWYAICILIGVIIAVVLGVNEGKKLGIAPDIIYVGVLIILPVSIIGARIWYVIFNASNFTSFAQILGFDSDGNFVGLAGLAIQGGVIFACISVFIYCKVRKISLFRIMDLVAPGFLIGQICGRWGNFFNQELYGPKITSSWYKSVISTIFGDQMYIDGALRHPVFLYESLLNLVMFVFMLVIRRKSKKALKIGDMIGLYLVWYGIVRIFTESLRLHSGVSEPLMAGPIPVSILISVIFIIAGITFLVLKRVLAGKEIKGKVIFPEQEVYAEVLNYVEEHRIDTVLFDLDGTLLNSRELIDRSFQHTFDKFRPDLKLTEADYDSFFGPTLYQTFSRYSKSEKEIEEMIAFYREYNIANYDDMVSLFPGAKDVIKTLNKKGIKIGIVSSKAESLVKHTIDLFNLNDYVNLVLGYESYENPKPAPDGILMAKEKLNAKNVLYVGDHINDMTAAHAANVEACGVLYISHPEIMLDAKPEYVINKLSELINIVGV